MRASCLAAGPQARALAVSGGLQSFWFESSWGSSDQAVCFSRAPLRARANTVRTVFEVAEVDPSVVPPRLRDLDEGPRAAAP